MNKEQTSSYGASYGAGTIGSETRSTRISHSLTRDNVYILQIALIGDLPIYEKRAWLLRLLDEQEFDPKTQLNKQMLSNNQMSQCNKSYTINDQKYCAEIRIVTDYEFMADPRSGDSLTFDVHRCSAILIAYDVINEKSLEKVREYLDALIMRGTNGGFHIIMMGVVPSMDSGPRHVHLEDATALAMEYQSMNVEVLGETNAKRGHNVTELMQKVITKCAQSTSV